VSSRADAGGPVNGIRKAVATQTPNLTAAVQVFGRRQ
jgi:hypothetical protein